MTAVTPIGFKLIYQQMVNKSQNWNGFEVLSVRGSFSTVLDVLLSKYNLLLPEYPDAVLGDTKQKISLQLLCHDPVKWDKGSVSDVKLCACACADIGCVPTACKSAFIWYTELFIPLLFVVFEMILCPVFYKPISFIEFEVITCQTLYKSFPFI
jgi:hypothetical protein